MYATLKRSQVLELALALAIGSWLALKTSDAQALPAAAGEHVERLAPGGWPSPANVECRDWAARENRQPFEKPRLIVTARCLLPTPAHKVELRPSNPQGINPRILLLDLIVHAPKFPAPQVLTPFLLRYEQPATTHYDSVSIMPDGPTIKVETTW